MPKSKYTSPIALERRRFATRMQAARLQDRGDEVDRRDQTWSDYSAKPDIWPAALTWKMAQDYSSMSPTFLRKMIKQEKLVFRPYGPKCSKIVLRDDLDKVLREFLSAESRGLKIEEDFDFG